MAKRNVGVEGTPPHLVVTFTYFLGGDHTNYKIYLDTERFAISESLVGEQEMQSAKVFTAQLMRYVIQVIICKALGSRIL